MSRPFAGTSSSNNMQDEEEDEEGGEEAGSAADNGPLEGFIMARISTM